MKVAVPEWQGRVSPVFDVAEQVRLVDVDGEKDRQRVTVSLENTAPHERARRLAELGVHVLVCGAISWLLEALLANKGIRVIPLKCGEVEEILHAFGDGTLEDGRFSMPGCRRQRWCRRNRRYRGGGGQEIEDIR
ncbi:MAG: NifB/NifX family molybdenum-iron cluster-binding protein [Pirellulaceae bacterium]